MTDDKEMKIAEEIQDADLEQVEGGYLGSDAYTKEQYSAAGVTWVHNTFSKDAYYYNGIKISQSEAEAFVKKYLLDGGEF